MQIHVDNPAHASDLVRLNEAWITELFEIEESDRQVAADPWRFVREGGHILSLVAEGEVVGVLAVIKVSDRRRQLSRFAVAAEHRGKGFGDLLFTAALRLAAQEEATSVFLYSHTKLQPALALYRKHGFQTASLGPHPSFARTNIVMERRLNLNNLGSDEADAHP